MARRSRARARPSDPQDIAARRLAKTSEALQQTRLANPELGGVGAGILTGPAGADVTVRAVGGQVLAVQRSHAFSACSLTVAQQIAADRYLKDWALRAGVRVTEDRPDDLYLVVDNDPGLAPGQNVTQRMIDAGGRIQTTHGLVGLADARLLANLVEPLVERGEVRVWRQLVLEATGESERHAQGVLVRRAAQSLVLAYEAMDADARRARGERRSNLRFAGGQAT